MFLNDDMPITLDSISRELFEGLPQELSGNRAWTKAVKTVLESIGHRNALFVCGIGCADNGEWLLDLLWMKPDDWRMVLAVECEWGDASEIEDDFLKLLSIKARMKLMIFSTRNQTSDILKRLGALMLKYPFHLAGEEYMAVDVTNRGAFRYAFTVPSDGRLKSADFTEVGAALDVP